MNTQERINKSRAEAMKLLRGAGSSDGSNEGDEGSEEDNKGDITRDMHSTGALDLPPQPPSAVIDSPRMNHAGAQPPTFTSPSKFSDERILPYYNPSRKNSIKPFVPSNVNPTRTSPTRTSPTRTSPTMCPPASQPQPLLQASTSQTSTTAAGTGQQRAMSQSQPPPNAVVFTAEEVNLLSRKLSHKTSLDLLKSLVGPDLSRIGKALSSLLSRVQSRGEALGSRETALKRSFEVFAGRGNMYVSVDQFADKIGNLSMGWSSFSGDECLGLARKICKGREQIELEDFRRFAAECLKNTDNNDDEDNGDKLLQLPQPTSFLEEKFQVLALRSRTRFNRNVWLLMDGVSAANKGRRVRKCENMLLNMGAWVVGRGGLSELDLDDGGVEFGDDGGNAEEAGDDYDYDYDDDDEEGLENLAETEEEEVMLKIAMDCARLRVELEKKEVIVEEMKENIVKKQENEVEADIKHGKSTEPKSKSKKNAKITKPPKSARKVDTTGDKLTTNSTPMTTPIPGTARFAFSKTPCQMTQGIDDPQTRELHKVNASLLAKSPKIERKNPTMQKNCTTIMMAAMGLPDEEERFDVPSIRNGYARVSAEDYVGLIEGDYLFPGKNTNTQMNGSASVVSSDSSVSKNYRGKCVTDSARKERVQRQLLFSQKKQQKQKMANSVFLRNNKNNIGGHEKEPKSKRPANLNIFKASRGSVLSQSTKNIFDAVTGNWEKKYIAPGRGRGSTAASKLFTTRHSDTTTQNFAKECFKAFD